MRSQGHTRIMSITVPRDQKEEKPIISDASFRKDYHVDWTSSLSPVCIMLARAGTAKGLL